MEELKQKSLKKWITLMIVLLVLVILVSVRLTSITVKGNSRYDAKQVEDMVFPDFWDKNTVFCFFKEKLMPHEELPFVEDYDIQLTGPFSCDLVVYEKSMVGYVKYMSSYMYFDKDGVIVESSGEKLAGIPEITGLQFGHIVLNQQLPIEDEALFNRIMNITQQLDYYGIACERIAFDASRNVTLSLSGGDIEAELGSGKDIDMKLSALNDMLPQLSGLQGTLDLREYDDSAERSVTSFRLRSEEEHSGKKEVGSAAEKPEAAAPAAGPEQSENTGVQNGGETASEHSAETPENETAAAPAQ